MERRPDTTVKRPPFGPSAWRRSIHPARSASAMPCRATYECPSNCCLMRSVSATVRNAATSRTTPATRSENSRRGSRASYSRRSISRARSTSRSGAGRDGSTSRSICMGSPPAALMSSEALYIPYNPPHSRSLPCEATPAARALHSRFTSPPEPPKRVIPAAPRAASACDRHDRHDSHMSTRSDHTHRPDTAPAVAAFPSGACRPRKERRATSDPPETPPVAARRPARLTDSFGTPGGR